MPNDTQQIHIWTKENCPNKSAKFSDENEAFLIKNIYYLDLVDLLGAHSEVTDDQAAPYQVADPS